jgi:hypothetical protein
LHYGPQGVHTSPAMNFQFAAVKISAGSKAVGLGAVAILRS